MSPYSRDFPEREAVKLVHSGHLEVRPDGSIWRMKHADPRRTQLPRRIDYAGSKKWSAHRGMRVHVKGVLYSVQAHRLVWQAHYGDIPPGLVVNHKDGDPSNNVIENLELLTQSANQKHRFDALGHKPSVTVIRQRYEGVVAAARKAVVTGELGGLEAALQAFDQGEARWRR